MFIVQCVRSAVKPECISAHTLRARARCCRSRGHSGAWGNFSARYSQIASESQMAKPSSTSTGTRPPGLTCSTSCLNCELPSKESKRTLRSVKGSPACFISTQGRMDQDE